MSESPNREIPTLGSAEGRHIQLALRPEHLALLENAGKWIGFLDDFYEALSDLIGADPHSGATLQIQEVDTLDAWARSGNPIQWRANGVADELHRINAGDVSWGIPHEISHNFDVAPACQYYTDDIPAVNSIEQWANLRTVYAFEKLSRSYPDATSYIADRHSMRIADIGWQYFVLQHAEPYLRSGQADWRHMHHDVFTGLLYLVKEEIGWEPFRKTFHDYQSRTFPTNTYDSIESKVSLFVNLLSNHAVQDLSPRFQEWGFPIVWVIQKEF